MFTSFSLAEIEQPEHLERLRDEVRAFLRAALEAGSYSREPSGWDRYDAEFSKRVAARGWIGMTWPEVLRRAREEFTRALRRHRRVVGRRRAGARALACRSPVRASPA
jgi:alkylation response protein AidB-like acyl-CoA dehydrogenase